MSSCSSLETTWCSFQVTKSTPMGLSARRSGCSSMLWWPKRRRSLRSFFEASSSSWICIGVPASRNLAMTGLVFGSMSTSLEGDPVVAANSRLSPPESRYTDTADACIISCTESASARTSAGSSLWVARSRPIRCRSKRRRDSARVRSYRSARSIAIAASLAIAESSSRSPSSYALGRALCAEMAPMAFPCRRSGATMIDRSTTFPHALRGGSLSRTRSRSASCSRIGLSVSTASPPSVPAMGLSSGSISSPPS